MEPVRDKDHAPPAPEGGGDTELHRYLMVLLERAWVIFASLVVGAALFGWWAAHQERIYQATTTIVVDATPPQVMGGDVRDVVQVGPGHYWQMQDYIQTQRRVLTSDRLAERAVTRLKLLDDAAFWGGERPASLEQAAHAFIDSVTADAVPDTQLIVVSFRHRDPQQAKRAADGLVDVYIESNEAWRDTSNASASTWLASESDDLRKRLSQSEIALYDFKRKNDLLSVSLEERINNIGRTIDKLNDALTEARLRRVARLSEADELERMNADDPDAISPAIGSPTLEMLKQQLTDEERKYSELRARYEELHPLVKQQAAKVASVQSGLKREIGRLIRGARARTNEAVEEEKKIAAQLEAAKQDGLRVTRLEVDYNKLKREAESLGKQYTLVENRTKETELASKIKVNNLHVLDYARVPGAPVSPHLGRSAAGAMVMALLIGIALALLLDALDRTIKKQEDIETGLGLPFLGPLPRVETGARSELHVADNPSSAAAECCRVIRTNLLYAGLKQPLQRLLVTSSLAREGKTLTTISLGVAMAQAGSRVLLIDSDLRRPRLQSALGIKNDIGLTDVLLGNVTLEEAIQPTGVENLSVLLSGGVPPNPAEVIESASFRALLDACAERYDRVVLDSPPALPVTDPAILGGYCDGVVLVVRSGRTGKAQARRARQTLTDVGARLLGVVLNDCVPRAYGYRYGYGYGYGYGSGRDQQRSSEKRAPKRAAG
jgi:capsular exopolysaccharide synthesis family protein